MAGSNGLAVQDFVDKAGPRTAKYMPSAIGWPLWQAAGNYLFTLGDVEVMRRDPQIQFGLRILKGPVQTATWTVTGDPEVAAFVDKALKQIWKRDLFKILHMLDYGHAAAEVVYCLEDGQVQLQELKDLYPRDVTALQRGGQLCGIRVRQGGIGGHIDLEMPRAFFVTNESEFGNLYGRSRLYGAWEPWMEKRGRHGAIDIRRGWYIKNAYRGGIMRYPKGFTQIDDAGGSISNQDVAREIAEKVETGGIIILPNTKDAVTGEYLWIYEEPKINGELRDVRDYPKDLDDEMLMGMGIPPEVVRAAETGSGFSGRSVPAEVFYTSEDAIIDTVVGTVDRQILKPLVAVNFGSGQEYTIEPQSLAKEMKKAQQEKATSGPAFLGKAGPFGQQPPGQQPGQQRFSQVTISNELRQRVRELAKKKYPQRTI